MIFKMYDCDVGIVLRGQRYDFDHVDSLQIEDPENTKLIRGANGTNKIGLSYKEGIKDPKGVTVNVLGLTAAMYALLSEAYESKERMDVYCVHRVNGSSKTAKNAVLRQQPMQLTVDETTDSMTVALAFDSFDLSEVHKE